MLDQKKLDSLLTGCRFWEKVQCFETVDSTNLIVKDWARQGAEEGRCAVAEAQTAGRGRRGRSWISPPGENLRAPVSKTGCWEFESLRPCQKSSLAKAKDFFYLK